MPKYWKEVIAADRDINTWVSSEKLLYSYRGHRHYSCLSLAWIYNAWTGDYSGGQVYNGTVSVSDGFVGRVMALTGAAGRRVAVFLPPLILYSKVEQPKCIVLREAGRLAVSVSQVLGLVAAWRCEDFTWSLNLRFWSSAISFVKVALKDNPGES